MGEMIEVYKNLKAHRRSERKIREEENLRQCAGLGIRVHPWQDGIQRIELERGQVMYYACSDKWQFRGKTFKGGPTKLKEWLDAQGYFSPVEE